MNDCEHENTSVEIYELNGREYEGLWCWDCKEWIDEQGEESW